MLYQSSDRSDQPVSVKPRILLIPNVYWWVIGEMGKEIIRCLPAFDFCMIPESVLDRRPALLQALLGEVDLVHALNESSVPMIVEANRSTGPPLITWIHHVAKWTPDHQAAVDTSAHLVACTPEWQEQIAAHSPRPVPSVLIPHGVDSQYFSPQPRQRHRLGIPEDAFAVAFLASRGSDADQGRKGIDTLFRVLESARGRIGNLHTCFVGIGWEREAERLRKIGISANFLGYLSRHELPGVYSNVDAYLMTSRVEGGPVTVLESLACATPVVATRVGLVPKVVRDRETGFQVAIDDHQAAASALAALAGDPAAARAMGARGRQLMLEQRCWPRLLQPLGEVYGKLAIARPRADGGDWVRRSARLQRASCSFDCLQAAAKMHRQGTVGLWRSWQTLQAMTKDLSWADMVRGVRLARAHLPPVRKES